MTASVVTPGTFRQRHDRAVSASLVLAGSAASALVGWVGAQLGLKGVILVAGGLTFVAALLIVERRQELLLAVGVLSVGALMHKSFTPLAEVSSGPPSVYVSSFDVMVGILWFSWFLRDPWEMVEDLRDAFRRRIMWLPIVAGLLMAPGLLLAGNSTLALAELVRMVSMYFVFVYFAARIRTREHVAIVTAALLGLVVVEAVIVAGQYLTTSALGLSVFGTPTILHNRFDGIAIARPFGTMAHPVFMGAFVGPLALTAFCLAIRLRHRTLRIVCLAVAGVGVTPLLLSSARSASLGVVVAFGVVVAWAVASGRMSAGVAGWWALAALTVAVLASPWLIDVWSSSFFTEHFSLEWRSRTELNEVALTMFEDRPIFGHGLNNFEEVLPRFDQFGLIFADNPVHNMYLLQAAETGVVGLLGLGVMGLGFFGAAARLAATRDRFLSAIGLAAVAGYVFWAVEEMLVFSLRQDHPRALYFILSGLVVACWNIHRRDPRNDEDPVRTATARRPRRRGSGAAAPAAIALAVFAAAVVFGSGGDDRASAADQARDSLDVVPVSPEQVPVGASASENVDLVFTAVSRVDGVRRIYYRPAGSNDIAQISPEDGRQYSWAHLAFNGRKIVFTARAAGGGAAEGIYWMNTDGSDVEPLIDPDFRAAQPSVSEDGRYMLFLGTVAGTILTRVYRWDMTTGEVLNLSSVSELSLLDSDPRFTPDGRVVFIDSSDDAGQHRPGEISVMDVAGEHRVRITSNGQYDTDPDMAPDRAVASARYIGEGEPRDPGADNPLQVKLEDFALIERSADGAERQLTQGGECFLLPATFSCTPEQGPAYVPRYTPDGARIGFVSILSSTSTCVCTIGRDGSDPRALLRSEDLALNWFDWSAPAIGPLPPIPDPVRPHDLPSRLLISSVRQGDHQLVTTRLDRFRSTSLPIDPTLEPREAVWAGTDRIVFVGTVPPAGDDVVYGPPPPEGESVSTRFRLDWRSLASLPSPEDRSGADRMQLFTVALDGSNLQQITTAGTEDWRDAIPEGVVRGNRWPAVSPDGRYVLFTNLDTATSDSFILRLDLSTGEVLSLTNATAGAVAVQDRDPAWSPDGSLVAFASESGGSPEIWVMDAFGFGAREVTADDALDRYPAWSPDGRRISFSSQTADGSWALVVLDLVSGERRTLVEDEKSTVLSSVWSPDGQTIAFIEQRRGLYDLSVVPADGSGPAVRNLTLGDEESRVDWR